MERPQTQGPKEAPPVQAPLHVAGGDAAVHPCGGGGGHGEEEVDVGVVADGLDVAVEGEDEADGDGEGRLTP